MYNINEGLERRDKKYVYRYIDPTILYIFQDLIDDNIIEINAYILDEIIAP